MSTDQSWSSESIHLRYLDQALSEAQKSQPKPTNFRVGCVIVSFQSPISPSVLATGYTLEIEGNTHAEQSALVKLALANGTTESSLPSILTEDLNVTLYTTLEPCGKRLSGNVPCVQRIIATRKEDPKGGIRKVVFGAKEPGTFVEDSQSCRMLTEAGVDWEYVPGLETDILSVAMEGHAQPKDQNGQGKNQEQQSQSSREQPKGTNVDDISPEERRRQEAQPRNPKKRMMEAPPGTG